MKLLAVLSLLVGLGLMGYAFKRTLDPSPRRVTMFGVHGMLSLVFVGIAQEAWKRRKQ